MDTEYTTRGARRISLRNQDSPRLCQLKNCADNHRQTSHSKQTTVMGAGIADDPRRGYVSCDGHNCHTDSPIDR